LIKQKNSIKITLAISSFLIFFFFSGIFLNSDEKENPLNDIKLQSPIEPFLGISSSFCEFRSNHLHGGVDFSTGQKNGLPVLATMDGEIREVKITYRGYGKAIYLYHKNNLTSVYAHLSKFHPSIEEYLKPFYEKSLYPGTVKIDPPIKVLKGDLVAYSGETGEGYPHLHYELRKNNNPINPIPYFSFTNQSKIEIRKLVITPEDPISNINGRFTKTIFPFPIKNEIKLSGPFSLGIEAYDLYNGNRRGVQKIEVYLDGEIVSKISPDIYSFDSFYGVRFLYDGTFSKFSPTRLVYNLNPQKRNPFSFISGKNYFDLPEGKHNFKIITYGISDFLEKKFNITVLKPLPKPPVLKQNIFLKSHFFLINQSGLFYPESIKEYSAGLNKFYIGYLKPYEKFILPPYEIIHKENSSVPFCFYLKNEDNKTSLKQITPSLYIEPKDLGLSKKIELSVNLKDVKEKEKLGIYRIRGNLYFGGNWDKDKLKAEVFAPDDYFVLRDDIAPLILKVWKKNNKIYVVAKDVGSGIPWDGVKILINNKEKILEYDPDHITAEGEIEGKGIGIITVSDYAQNKASKTFAF